jgi:hypothetical protein
LVDLIRRLSDTESKQAFFDAEQRLLEHLKEEERGNTDTDSEERAFRNADIAIYSQLIERTH